jgi:hypothetical protein
VRGFVDVHHVSGLIVTHPDTIFELVVQSNVGKGVFCPKIGSRSIVTG